MDFHPIIAHFPIALLVLYSIFEILRFRFLTTQEYWFYVKAILSIVGLVTANLASQFGETAESLHGLQGNKLVELHSNFADLSTIIYALLAFSYVVMWIERVGFVSRFQEKFIITIWRLFKRISNFVLSPGISVTLALLGLVAISITGGLGGVIVFGRDFDPLMNPILNFFGL